jgi:hypothetical protein
MGLERTRAAIDRARQGEKDTPPIDLTLDRESRVSSPQNIYKNTESTPTDVATEISHLEAAFDSDIPVEGFTAESLLESLTEPAKPPLAGTSLGFDELVLSEELEATFKRIFQ